jgi:hypothetical protein
MPSGRFAALKIVLAGAFACTSYGAAPSAAELEAALSSARAEWHVDLPPNILVEADLLNSCDLKTIPQIAKMEDRWTETSVVYDGAEEPTVQKTHIYVIKVNSGCDWSNRSLSLRNAVIHEVGHILLGYQYHSQNKRSIMYYVVRASGQQILPEDRNLLTTTQATKE